MRGLSVSAGPADLLGVALQTLGQVVMVDVADVGLVDPHAEGDRRHDDHVRGVMKHPGPRRLLVVLEAGVVSPAANPAAARSPATSSAVLLERDVDDRRNPAGRFRRSLRGASALLAAGQGVAMQSSRFGAVEAVTTTSLAAIPKATATSASDLRRGGRRQREHSGRP